MNITDVRPRRTHGPEAVLVVPLHLIYTTLYATSSILSAVVVFVAWRHRAARGAVSVAAMMLGVAIWSLGYMAAWNSPPMDQQIFWSRFTSFGSFIVPVAFLMLAFDVAGMERWRTPGRIATIAIASLLINNAEWVDPGGFFPERFEAHAFGAYIHYALVPSPLYWAFVVYAYVLIVIAAAILLRMYVRSSGPARTQALLLLVGGLVPTFANIVSLIGPIPADLDLTPLAFLITGAMWLTAIIRGTLLDLLPLARHALVEQMLDGVLVFDGADHAVDVNPAALTMLDSAPREVLGKNAEDILGGVRGADEVLSGRDGSRAVLPIGPDVDSRYVDLGVTPLFVGLGAPPAQLVTLHDVTEERRANERHKLSRQVFDTANEGIVVTAPDGTIIDVNSAFIRMHGVPRDEVVGKNPRMFKSDRQGPEFYRKMWTSIRETGAWSGEIWDRRADDSVFPKLLSIAAVKDESGGIAQYVGIFSDITDIKAAEGRLRHLATHDSLTRLPNRALFDDRLTTVLARSRRQGSPTAVFFFDLDDFKEVNDSFGHQAGDRLLVEVAARCMSVVRESDTVGRNGGDEFTVIVSEYASTEDLGHLAHRLLDAIAKPVVLGDDEIANVTASIGIAVFPDDADDAAELIRRADVAMYRAKMGGRNRYEFFSAVPESEGGG